MKNELSQSNGSVTQKSDKVDIFTSDDGRFLEVERKTMELIAQIMDKNDNADTLESNIKEKRHWLKFVALPLLVTFIPMAFIFVSSALPPMFNTGQTTGAVLMLTIALLGAIGSYFFTAVSNIIIYRREISPQIKRVIELDEMLRLTIVDDKTVGYILACRLKDFQRKEMLKRRESAFLSKHKSELMIRGFFRLDSLTIGNDAFKAWNATTDKLSLNDRIYTTYSLVEAYAASQAIKGETNRFFKNSDDYFKENYT